MKVLSPVFGTLALLFVESGGEVTVGEDLAEVESMKVFFRVMAPASGKVHWSVELGQVVDEGGVIGEVT